jgi:hypothetical protein
VGARQEKFSSFVDLFHQVPSALVKLLAHHLAGAVFLRSAAAAACITKVVGPEVILKRQRSWVGSVFRRRGQPSLQTVIAKDLEKDVQDDRPLPHAGNVAMLTGLGSS